MCPVCRITLKPGTTNIELNQHVDRCLGQAVSTDIPQVISDDEIEIIEVSNAKPVPKRSKPPDRAKVNKRKASDKTVQSDKPNKLQNAFNLMMSRK